MIPENFDNLLAANKFASEHSAVVEENAMSPSAGLNIGVFRKIHERRGEKVGRLASFKILQGSERILVRKMDQAIPTQYEV
jgi:hypothetical protein